MEEVNELQRLVRYGILLQSFMLTLVNSSLFLKYIGMTVNNPFRVECISSYFLILCLSRALLEGERVGLHDAQRRTNQHQRERVIGTVAPEICSRVMGFLWGWLRRRALPEHWFIKLYCVFVDNMLT